MIVHIKKIDKSLSLPRYQTGGAAGFDLVTREDTAVLPGEIKLVPGNVVVKVPEGYVLLIIPRSSLPKKKGLICPHSIGVIDSDYCGEKDEIFVQVQNITPKPVTVLRGERIAQGVFVKMETAQWKETEEAFAKTRGGFGTTGA